MQKLICSTTVKINLTDLKLGLGLATFPGRGSPQSMVGWTLVRAGRSTNIDYCVRYRNNMGSPHTQDAVRNVGLENGIKCD